MAIDDNIRDESYNTILTEKLQKHQHYHLGKIDKYEYLTREEILTSNKIERRIA